MKRRASIWILAAAVAGAAMAELPPPTPEEKAKLQKESAAKAKMLEHQKQALAREQERIARQYRARHPGAESGRPPGKVEERVGKGDVPKAAKQPIGAPGKPHSGRKPMPQAEAHSQSAE